MSLVSPFLDELTKVLIKPLYSSQRSLRYQLGLFKRQFLATQGSQTIEDEYDSHLYKYDLDASLYKVGIFIQEISFQLQQSDQFIIVLFLYQDTDSRLMKFFWSF